MEEDLIRGLLRRTEGDALDFKRDQYPFRGQSDVVKSELLKDILAFANAWKDSDAYILIGVREKQQRADGLEGVSSHLADHEIQQFVNKKTNRPVKFNIEAVEFEGVELDVIQIAHPQSRPLFLATDFGKLTCGVVYVRRGSSTDVATADEIAEMGRASVSAGHDLKPVFEVVGFAQAMNKSTGLVATIVVQLNNASDRTARDIEVTVRHDETNCVAHQAQSHWHQRSDLRLNPRRLFCDYALNPQGKSVIMDVPLCENSPLPFGISVVVGAADCPPVTFRGSFTREKISQGEPLRLECEAI